MSRKFVKPFARNHPPVALEPPWPLKVKSVPPGLVPGRLLFRILDVLIYDLRAVPFIPTGRAPKGRWGEAETGGEVAGRNDEDAEVDRGAAANGDRSESVEFVVGTETEKAVVSICGTDPYDVPGARQPQTSWGKRIEGRRIEAGEGELRREQRVFLGLLLGS